MNVEHCVQDLISQIGEMDSAETFFNTAFNEAYHSKIGPLIEAKHKFITPSNIEELLIKNKKIKILDLFFGLGYNTDVEIDFAYKVTKNPFLEITAVEIDEKIIEKINDIIIPDWYKQWKAFLSNLSTNKYIEYKNVSIQLYMGDVLKLIEILPKNYFDIIFFDPFSHKSTPEFWDQNFLRLVFNLLGKGGILTTYSGLKRVEILANQIGFSTKRIAAIGRKKHSLAIINSPLISDK